MTNFAKYVSRDIVKIVIYSLKNRDERENILNLFYKDVAYEITIFNIKILPVSVLEKFEELKHNIKKITVNEKRLAYYLRSLGFRVEYEEQKKFLEEKRGNNIRYVGLGGSAGSLEKFIDIVKNLPKSDFSFFIVMHKKRDSESFLAEILQRYTKNYNVVLAKSNMKVEPSTIYVAPPNKQMIVVGGYIFLTDDNERNFAKPSISTTFESLAYEYNEQLLVILVCGYGADGSDSLKLVRKRGGLVVVEQPYECKATPMLENAINTKEYDFLLSIYDIPKLLQEKMTKKSNIHEYLSDFLEEIYKVYGYDFRHYDREHIVRRVEYFYNRFGFNTFVDFKHKVLNDKDYFKEMFLDISVNVTTFFRNPNTYKQLKEIILEEFRDKKSIKIWCAGCSTGEEPYSIAIILKELGLLDRSLIYATDLNDVVLQQAKNGAYSIKSYELFLNHYMEMGGVKNFAEYFKFYNDFFIINDDIKNKILFFKHNLVTDGSLNEFQLIFCRNVLIYFNKSLTNRVFDLFDTSLEENGVLVLGESETINRNNFKTLNKKNKIYKKLTGV